MRFKYLKYLAFVLGGLSTAVATGALYLYATFDGVRLAAELTHFTKQRYQRVLKLDGPVELSMFPRLQLRLPASTLSGKNGEGEFMGIGQAAVSVRLLPLLARRVVVDRVELDGLRLALLRGKDGKVSGMDLLNGADTDNQPVALDLTSLVVRGGTLNWTDELTGRKLALAQMALSTGRLGRQADGQMDLDARLTQAMPAVDAHVQVQSAYRIDVDGQDQQARNLHLSLKGDLAGQQGVELDATLGELLFPADGPPRLAGVSLLAKGKADGEAVELKATSPRLIVAAAGPEADAVDATLRVDGKTRNGSLRTRLTGLRSTGRGLDIDKLTADVDWRLANGRLTGSLASAASWQGGPQVLDAPAITGQLNYAASRAGATPLKIAVQGSGRADLNRKSAAGKLDLQADGSHLQGSWSLPRLSPLALGFDVDVDRFKFDTHPGDTAGKKADEPAGPIDFSALRGYELDGVVRVGSLQVAGLHLERARIPLSVHGGRLVSSAHSASLYGGSVEGSLTLEADGNKLAYRSYLQNANVASLLRDAIGKEHFAGVANLFVDVTGAGATGAELRSGLQGLARVRFRNGVVHGIDVNAALKEWRSLIAGRQTARRPHRHAETTSFDEVTASFQIGKGLARNTDLQARSGLFRVTGAGDIDIVAARIDYLSRVTLMVVPFGPDSGLLASLRGVTVPIRVKGPLAEPEWHLEPGVPGAPLVTGLVNAGQAVVRSVVKAMPKVTPKPPPKVIPKAAPAQAAPTPPAPPPKPAAEPAE